MNEAVRVIETNRSLKLNSNEIVQILESYGQSRKFKDEFDYETFTREFEGFQKKNFIKVGKYNASKASSMIQQELTRDERYLETLLLKLRDYTEFKKINLENQLNEMER